MPVHLLLAGDDQAIVLLVIIFGVLVVRRWRVTRAIVTALLIGAGLVALTVIVDLYILHQITGYLSKLGHIIE
jgi:multisubunit Na+/H+ antiporter MnhB subunit